MANSVGLQHNSSWRGALAERVSNNERQEFAEVRLCAGVAVAQPQINGDEIAKFKSWRQRFARVKARSRTNPSSSTTTPGSPRRPGAFRPRVYFETAFKDLMNLALASQTLFLPTNLQLRRTQQRRTGAGRFEPIATIFWALASLIAACVAAFA
ncbi:MAG TPA: hypothetical protein VN694_13095 [Caulobacteraceae bacterium]|nr:hypothetical protein [Caulobacteraceae bacterium]